MMNIGELLTWLYTICDEDSSHIDSEGIIYFYIDDFHSFRIHFELEESFDKEIPNISEINFNEFVKVNRINGISLVGSSIWSDVENINSYINSQLSFELYVILHKLYEINCKFLNYTFTSRVYNERDVDWGCPEVYESGYFIILDDSIFQNLEIIKKIVAYFPTDWDKHSIYRNQSKVPYLRPELKLFSTNTKVRRLGYIKGFISLFDGIGRIPEIVFIHQLRRQCELYLSQLNEHINNKGVLQISYHQAGLQPYVDLASNLGFLSRRNNGYEIDKYGQLYQKMSSENQDASNVFQLSIMDKSFFLESILVNDFLCIFLILEYSFIHIKSNYHELKKEFQKLLLRHIDSLISNCEDNRDCNYYHTFKKRVMDWKKPEVYMEHILMPRLNWLLDLELLEIDSTLQFSLSTYGVSLFKQLSQWQGISLCEVSSPSYFIERFFIKIFCKTYHIEADDKIEYTQLLKKCLDESFELFRTIAPNRVAYSNFVGYAKRKLLLSNSVAIDEFEIRKFLENNSENYIYKYQQYYHDGYIQLKK